MALVLGTNSGFVTVAPTADPAGSDTVIDGASVVTKHTTPAGATKIVQIGWYRGSGTNASNFEIALYSESGGVAAARLFVDNTNSSTSSGWITVTVDWAISENTAYWLALQMDSHSGSSNVDSATSGGAGIDRMTSQTTLNDPYGGGAVDDADGMYAIYALVRGRKDFSDTLNLTSSTSDAKLFKSVNVSDALGLTSSIANPKLFRQVSVSDALGLTSSISDPDLSVANIKNFSDSLALSSLISDPKLFRLVNCADTLGLTSQTSSPKLYRLVTVADTLGLTSNVSDPNLNVHTLYNFSDSLNLTSLVSDPKLFRQVNYIDSLNLTSLVSDPKLFRQVNLSDLISLSSEIADFELTTGNTINFSDSLNLTSLISDPKLFRQVNYSDVLNLDSLINDIRLYRHVNYADVLALSSLISSFELSVGEATPEGHISTIIHILPRIMNAGPGQRRFYPKYIFTQKEAGHKKTIINQ